MGLVDKTKIDWWRIGNSQNLHLALEETDLLIYLIEKKIGSLHRASCLLDLDSSTFYTKLKYRKQGISVKLLKQLLDCLKISYGVVGKYPVQLGWPGNAILRY